MKPEQQISHTCFCSYFIFLERPQTCTSLLPPERWEFKLIRKAKRPWTARPPKDMTIWRLMWVRAKVQQVWSKPTLTTHVYVHVCMWVHILASWWAVQGVILFSRPSRVCRITLDTVFCLPLQKELLPVCRLVSLSRGSSAAVCASLLNLPVGGYVF